MELKRWHLRDAPFDVLKNLTEVILRIPLPVMLGAASYLRTREKYLYHIDPCRFACNDDGFNFSDSPIFAGALHNLALCEFIDHLILVELFLALDAVVVVHDVFHIPAGRLTNPAATIRLS